MRMRDLAVTAAIVLGIGAPPAAVAQDESTQGAPAAEYSDADVDAFVDAVDATAEVDAQWRPRIEGAADAQEAQALSAQAQNEMITAIEDTGMTLEAYNTILRDAQADPVLAERITLALRERLGEAADDTPG